MHKHYSRGLTIIELLVVTVIILIIALSATLAYTQVQKDTRDTKRDTDITMLINELEAFYDRSGEYPPGCPDPTCPSALHTANISATPLTATTTMSNLTKVLPGIKPTYGDPQSPNKALPLKDRTVNERK
jgi:prepilin-type N-terminal cleavage/methylation domain-containing protein